MIEFPKRNEAKHEPYQVGKYKLEKKTVAQLAWNSFAWFASEPEKTFILKESVFKLKNEPPS